MKLSELKFEDGHTFVDGLPRGLLSIYHNRGVYIFYYYPYGYSTIASPKSCEHWVNMDELTAQAVLYELTKESAHS